MAGRVSQDVIEPLVEGAPKARVSQEVIESLVEGAPHARVSQQALEALLDGKPLARISQDVLEILAKGGKVRISQIVLEPLIVNLEVELLVYPTLPGLAYNVGWDTEFFNMKSSVTSTGAEIDLGLSQYPLHDFTLTYEFLRDAFGFTEQKTMRGFFMAVGGNLGRFLFRNPADFEVRRQLIATTDGVNHVWTLIRTYGAGEYSSSEPVGMVDTTMPFNLYLNGLIQDASTYTVVTSEPGNQQVQFAAVPASGQQITADMDYFYYCKFADPKITLEEFMHKLWTLSKIQLHSCRAGA
jgi:hypothetical protein